MKKSFRRNLNLTVSRIGAPSFNVDLYGIGFQFGDPPAPINEFLELDTPDFGNVRLQNNIFTPTTESQFLGTNADGDAALANYLRSFYDANPGYDGGAFAFLRLNPDSQPPSGENLFTINSGDNSGPTTLDILTVVPEPGGTVAMLTPAALGLLRRRRRSCV